MNHFREAFDRTMKIEGGESDNPRDIGGKTFMGISRVYWPKWDGWELVDSWLNKNKITALGQQVLSDRVESFYRINFWDRIQGDKLAKLSPEVAYEVFDAAVNMDVPDAVRFLQTGLNMQRTYCRAYQELLVDGLLGPVTLMALDRYLATQPGDRERNGKILLNCMNGEQYIHYKTNPQHPYFRGWFLRV